MRYRCCFLNEDDQVVRIEELDGYDESAVHRERCSFGQRPGSLATNCGGTAGRWMNTGRSSQAAPPIPAATSWTPSSTGSPPPTNSPVGISINRGPYIAGGTRSGKRGSRSSRAARRRRPRLRAHARRRSYRDANQKALAAARRGRRDTDLGLPPTAASGSSAC
jgi:hypothetical protein